MKKTFSLDDIANRDRYLLEAIALAAKSRLAGDPPFGSVLVDAAGLIVQQDRNTVISAGDITAHPELKLARWAAQNYPPELCPTLSMYTSCEPCPMCTNAIARARIGRVAFALSTEQLQALKPTDHIDPDSTVVNYVGPALYEEAIQPLNGYY